MSHKDGVRVVRWKGGWHGKKIKQWTPRTGERWLRVVSGDRWYLIQWLPREGWWITSAGIEGPAGSGQYYSAPRYQGDAMKRRNLNEGGKATTPALPSLSTILGKLPALREFVTATSYDDGSARVPGYFTFRNRGIVFEVTVYDPDSGTRLAARAPKIDEALCLIEQLLGVEEAPWEIDQYLTDQLLRRAKKKRA